MPQMDRLCTRGSATFVHTLVEQCPQFERKDKSFGSMKFVGYGRVEMEVGIYSTRIVLGARTARSVLCVVWKMMVPGLCFELVLLV